MHKKISDLYLTPNVLDINPVEFSNHNSTGLMIRNIASLIETLKIFHTIFECIVMEELNTQGTLTFSVTA